MITEIDVAVPVRTAYDQWTQFEDFPLFMKNVESVRQIDDQLLHWKVSIAGITREWDARITEQTPDQRIAWTSIDGADNAGVVTFHHLDDQHTRVVLQLDMEPSGFLENVADKGGMVKDRAKKDLESFKDFIESRRHATGTYRGTIDRQDGVVDDGRGSQDRPTEAAPTEAAPAEATRSEATRPEATRPEATRSADAQPDAAPTDDERAGAAPVTWDTEATR